MPKDPVFVARSYADAYAAFDVPALREALAPTLQFRQINPGGYLSLTTADDYIDATKAFLDGFDRWEPACASAEPFGDRVATTSRLRLHQGGHSYLMQHSEIVTVRDGKVVAIDSACSGPRPEVAQ